MDMKDLKALLKVMRKNGISHYKTAEIELQMSPEAFQLKDDKEQEDLPNLADGLPGRYDNFPEGELTPEQLMFYSAGGTPEEDPYRKDS